jgi:hypothetical protein
MKFPSVSSFETPHKTTLPFGLPLGTVRAFMALLILGNFWMVLLWPIATARPMLGHFIMLPLVLFSFTLSREPHAGSLYTRVLPYLLRLALVGGSAAIVIFLTLKGFEDYRDRLTPDVTEFKEFWLPFTVALGVGFLTGILLNWLFGPKGDFFRSVRAWLGAVAMLLLTVELSMFIIHLNGSNDPGFMEFLRNYQVFQIGVVSAYFGSRL